MPSRKHKPAGENPLPAGKTQQQTRSRTMALAQSGIPKVYRDMILEAKAEGASLSMASAKRPLKRRRLGKDHSSPPVLSQSAPEMESHNQDDIADEDMAGAFKHELAPEPILQTIMRESDDEEDDEGEEIVFEDVELAVRSTPVLARTAQANELSLDLTATKAAMNPGRFVNRRKAVTRQEKERRVRVHKLHLLCLLSHAEHRNRWCNDEEIQKAVRPLLSSKTVDFLHPRASLGQFGCSESVRRGIREARTIFFTKFCVTERGIRMGGWADEEDMLQNYPSSDDIDSVLDRDDFLKVAKTLQGSRDVGAQLFCAMLRGVGVETRLVCSLQALSCHSHRPPMSKTGGLKVPRKKVSCGDLSAAAMEKYESHPEPSSACARTRLGHPDAAAYKIPSTSPSTPPAQFDKQAAERIRGESAFPVWWVEVLDVAHQKWQPVDPLVTKTQWKTDVLEPPASDHDNRLSYVVAFESDGSALDVTRRYAKAYNSKTRRHRIDGLAGQSTTDWDGPGWWRKVLDRYKRPLATDLDQIEANELAAEEAREPMPKNLSDFKDHPVFALERHMRRHEVLVPGAQTSGTVGAGSKGPLNKIYRRKDVRIARSREKWHRLGREVKAGEEPVKMLPKQATGRSRPEHEDDADDADGGHGENGENGENGKHYPDRLRLLADAGAGTPIYTIEQTELYRPSPVTNGRVPKNKFGSVEVYVPSMVPEGGVHMTHERAAHAAFFLGVDYAPALTGFRFKGRKGTAVLTGIVLPTENEEAVTAVIQGLLDVETEMEQERRSRNLLRLWTRFLKALRIREQVWADADLDEEERADMDEVEQAEMDWCRGRGRGKAVAPAHDGEDADRQDTSPDVSAENSAAGHDEFGGGGFLI